MSSLRHGGAERVASFLARSLAERGVTVRLLALQEGPLRATLEDHGVPCDVLPVASKWDVSAVARIRRYLRDHGADVLHTHCPRTTLLGGPAARMAGTRVVTTFHTLSTVYAAEAGRQAGWRLAAEGLLDRLWVDGCVAVSEQIRADAARARRLSLAKIRTIHNAVDLARFRPLEGEAALEACRRYRPPGARHVIAAVGRLVALKGHQVLLAALARLRERVPGLHLLLIGDGPRRADLERQCAELDVRHAVTFVGETLEPRDVLSVCDLFVYPSLQGAFGLAALEAMACGLPVVASALPGTPEFVTDGETAVLVPPGDSQGLAEAIEGLLLAPEKRRALAAAGRDMVERRFGPERFAAAHLELYRTPTSSRWARRSAGSW